MKFRERIIGKQCSLKNSIFIFLWFFQFPKAFGKFFHVSTDTVNFGNWLDYDKSFVGYFGVDGVNTRNDFLRYEVLL